MKLSHIMQIAKTYDTLLVRYARLQVKDQKAAEKIVIELFEQYHDGKVVLDGLALRRYFQSRLTRMCKQWLANRPTVFIVLPKSSLN